MGDVHVSMIIMSASAQLHSMGDVHVSMIIMSASAQLHSMGDVHVSMIIMSASWTCSAALTWIITRQATVCSI